MFLLRQNSHNRGLLSLWWSPTVTHAAAVHSQRETIFYDVVEARHLKPHEFWGKASQSSEPAAAAPAGLKEMAAQAQPVFPSAASGAYTTEAPPGLKEIELEEEIIEQEVEEPPDFMEDDADTQSSNGNSGDEGEDNDIKNEVQERRGTDAASGAQSSTQAPRGRARKRHRSRSQVVQKEMEGDDTVTVEVDLTLYMSLSINTPLSKKKRKSGHTLLP